MKASSASLSGPDGYATENAAATGRWSEGQLAFGRVGEGRKGEDREQGRPEDRYDDSDCLDHFFFPGCR